MEAPCQLRGLRSLRLALSDVRELALALPLLTTLDVNGCAGLSVLELRCPALLHGLFQSVGRCAAAFAATLRSTQSLADSRLVHLVVTEAGRVLMSINKSCC